MARVLTIGTCIAKDILNVLSLGFPLILSNT